MGRARTIPHQGKSDLSSITYKPSDAQQPNRRAALRPAFQRLRDATQGLARPVGRWASAWRRDCQAHGSKRPAPPTPCPPGVGRRQPDRPAAVGATQPRGAAAAQHTHRHARHTRPPSAHARLRCAGSSYRRDAAPSGSVPGSGRTPAFVPASWSTSPHGTAADRSAQDTCPSGDVVPLGGQPSPGVPGLPAPGVSAGRRCCLPVDGPGACGSAVPLWTRTRHRLPEPSAAMGEQPQRFGDSLIPGCC
jgi:hypothetical protein